MYEIKILTEETLEKLNKFLEEITNNETGLRKKFSMLEWREYVYSCWNNPIGRESMRKLLTEFGLQRPEFKSEIVPSAEMGYQSRPRIEWKGEIQKIDDVDQIYSYKMV